MYTIRWWDSSCFPDLDKHEGHEDEIRRRVLERIAPAKLDSIIIEQESVEWTASLDIEAVDDMHALREAHIFVDSRPEKGLEAELWKGNKRIAFNIVAVNFC